jgi:DNA-binding NtrC family response regulator
VIAATNVDLRTALEQGTFREDLYYRLNVVPINIPPLRERREDIPYLVEHFAKQFNGQISEGAMERLMTYHWPGNVRELENVVERSVLLAQGPRVEAEDVKIDLAIGRPRPAAAAGDHFLPEGMTLDEYEQSIIREALKRANGNKSQAARLLGLTRNALRYRLAQMGIEESGRD